MTEKFYNETKLSQVLYCIENITQRHLVALSFQFILDINMAKILPNTTCTNSFRSTSSTTLMTWEPWLIYTECTICSLIYINYTLVSTVYLTLGISLDSKSGFIVHNLLTLLNNSGLAATSFTQIKDICGML